MIEQPFDRLPIWSVYPFAVVLLVVALAAGYYFVKCRLRQEIPKSDAGIGAISAATLGLLAFLLAFVVGFGVTVNHERRSLLVSEANAIGTTYLRAGYIDEPYSSQSRELLREYTDQRVAGLRAADIPAAKASSEAIHAELWQLVEELIQGGSTTPTTGLYVSSLNEVIDLHTERVNLGLYVRIPPLVILSMYGIAFLALFLVGMQMGYTEKRSLFAPGVLILVLAVVLYIISDLDRPMTGLMQTPTQVLLDLQAQLPKLP